MNYVDTFQISQELKSYWGFSTPVDKPEDVPYDENISPSAGAIKPAKPTDGYGLSEAYSPNQSRTSHRVKRSQSPSAEYEVEDILRPGEAADPQQSWIYNRTTRWLKDLINHSEAYSSKLTGSPRRTTLPELPLRSRDNTLRSRSTYSDPRKTSSAARELTSRDLTRRSTVKTSHSVDNRYKSTVKDLENILSNAIELAKEAVEHFEYRPSNKSDDESMPGTYPDDAEMQFTYARYVAYDAIEVASNLLMT